MKTFFRTAICCLYLFCSFSLAQKNDPEDLQELINKIDQIRQKHHIAATGLTIIQNGKLIYSDGLGALSHESEKKINKRSIFRIGSITKTFTALGALKLAESKKLDLDTPIRPHLPKGWLANAWQQSQPIHLSHLLEHTAGLPDLGAAYVGFVIERIVGQSYENYMQEQIFHTLDMRDTSLLLTEEQRSRFVLGYDRDGKTRIPYWYMTYRPFGAINTTLADMNKFLFMMIRSGLHDNQKFIGEKWFERMEVPKTTLAAKTYDNFDFGYGAGNYAWFTNGVLFHGHGGDADGYLSRYGYTRSTKSGYFHVISAFNKRAHWQINKLIEQFLTRQNVLTRPELPTFNIIDERLGNQLSGTYQPLTYRFKGRSKKSIQITYRNNRLFHNLSKQTRELFAVDDYLFRYANEFKATSAFVIQDDRIIYETTEGSFEKLGER